MALLEQILDRRRLILTVALLVSATGFAAWLTMNRQEDPLMPAYWGQVVVVYPGADAEMMERLVLEPVEDALAEVEEIATVESNAYSETAVVAIDLKETTGDTDAAWDDVRRALVRAQQEFPAGVAAPVLNDSLNTDHDAVVVAITGSAEPLALLDAARTLRRALLGVPGVATVKLLGDPGEQVTVDLEDAAARRLGLTADAVAAQLGGRTAILPGGSLALGERTVRLRPRAEMESVAEIAASPVALPAGGAVPLGEIARVRLGPREPAGERMRLDGELAVGLGVVAEEHAHALRFGDAVRSRVAAIAPTLAPLEVRTLAFQPERVGARLSQLNQSLLMGILIVAGVVILAMGLRLGLVVASVVPLVTFAALALFAIGGGVLHQISVAALVLALGMLVDNAIVVAENIQWRLDRGAERREAAAAAVRELAVPLAAATGTTVAAFLPMLLAESGTADFTRTIPVMVILALVISYLFAIFVTPILSEAMLLPGASRATAVTSRAAELLARLAVRRTRWVLLAAVLLVAAAAAGAGAVRQQFFPAADRNQLVVDLKLPEGSHLDATDQASRTLERLLLARPEVRHVAAFMGRGAPRFYYNIQSVPWSPHFAQLMVETRTTADVEPLLDWLRQSTPASLPGLEVIGRRLEQGPPVGAPVEVRVSSDRLDELATAVAAVAAELRRVPGAADVRHDLGAGEPTLSFRVDDPAAARLGLSRADVARALAGHTRGLPVGELRADRDPVPIVVRDPAGERLPADALAGLDVSGRHGRPVPLAQVASVETGWRPAVIHHRDRQRVATVSAQLVGDATFSDVLTALEPRLAQLGLPAGVRVSFGGDAEGSGEANTALLRSLPIGLLVLLGVLLAEFNSFRRVGLVLVTVPLAATGVVPGLLIGGQPFGFMSLLGVFALVGIVVNNAIVLLEVVEQQRRDGAPVDAALAAAVDQRIRPILLTTATTVCGLLPLAFSSSTLWPPLAWAMISGLIASTLLTLVVVPALYRAVFGRGTVLRRRAAAAAATAALLAWLLSPGTTAAEPLRPTLAESMALAQGRPAAVAADAQAAAADHAAIAERRSAYLPTVGVLASAAERDRTLELETPIGSFPFGASRVNSAALEVTQPLLDPARLLHANPATRAESEAVALTARRRRQELAAAAGRAHLDVLAIDARLAATRSFVTSLAAELDEMRSRVDAGRALEADALKLELAVDQARQDEIALVQGRTVAVARLAQAVGQTAPVEPRPVPDWTDRPAPAADDAIVAALAARPDLAALQAERRGLDHRRAAVRLEGLPRLDARAALTWSDGSPYRQTSWLEGAVTLSWSPLAAGTRAPRAAAIAASGSAVSARLEETRTAVALEVRAALAALAVAQHAVTVGERGITQAGETLRVERERHAAGRATTNDLLAAEARLRDTRTRREVAELEVVRAWIALWLATAAPELGVPGDA